MKLKPFVEIEDVAGEFMAIPVGGSSEQFKGIIALNEESAFLLKSMKHESKTKRELVELLTTTYVVDAKTAECDVDKFLEQLISVGVIEDL